MKNPPIERFIYIPMLCAFPLLRFKDAVELFYQLQILVFQNPHPHAF